MNISKLATPSFLAVAVLSVAGCNGTTGSVNPGGGPAAGGGGSLPISATGRMLAVRLPGTITSDTNQYTQTPQQSVDVTGVVATDRTAATGVGISGSVEEDPSPNQNQGNQVAPAALVSASADGPMTGGTTFIGLDKAKGNVYFENGSFGDPQAESANAAISTVSVYNPQNQPQIALKEATTVRYRDGNAGDTEANFGVGYVGNATANMPGSGTATYRSFYEQGVGVYNDNGTVRQMYLTGDAQLTADFAAGTVTGGVSNGALQSYNNTTNTITDLNPAIEGLAIDATISGADFNGTARLVDAGGNAVGTVTNGNAIGGFFGDNAAETAAAVSIEGNAELGGQASDYVLQGVIGGVRN